MADVETLELQVTALEALMEKLGTKANAGPDESEVSFQDVVEYVQERDHCSRSAALTKARQEAPEIFQAWQDGPRPNRDFDKLVRAEIAKGCSPAVAAQRVGLMHPDLTATAVNKFEKKRDSAFDDVVEKIAKAEKVSRSEAMVRARKRNPKAFAAYQAS